jgi:hypothetical protein
MAGRIFGADRLPLDPPFSYQLVATRDRHAMIREGDASQIRDSEGDNKAEFSSFEVQAPRRAAKQIEIGALDSSVAQLWPLSVRLNARGQRGDVWNLEFPFSHISSRPGEFQIESGPALIPRDVINIADASIVNGCYLAYVFVYRASQVDLLAWGPTSDASRSFVHFARIGDTKTEVLSGQL